jgi:hypothetical protein
VQEESPDLSGEFQMPTIPLPDDFREFLKLLTMHRVKYLLVGGYAVA